jgi:hypothetical protein
MESGALFLGIAVLSALLLTFLGIRYKKISAKLGFIVMLLMPFLFNLVIVINKHGSAYEILCVGSLLSLVFGPATYAAGIWLENSFKDK